MIERITIITFGISFFGYSIVMLEFAWIFSIIVFLITVLPAILYLTGSRKARLLMLVFNGWLLALWPFLPLCQHSVDLTPRFWLIYVYFGVLIFLTTIVVFRMDKRKLEK